MIPQTHSQTGKVQVRFSLQPKFNSFVLDSEVGRLVPVSRRIYLNNRQERSDSVTVHSAHERALSTHLIEENVDTTICIYNFQSYETGLDPLKNPHFHSVFTWAPVIKAELREPFLIRKKSTWDQGTCWQALCSLQWRRLAACIQPLQLLSRGSIGRRDLEMRDLSTQDSSLPCHKWWAMRRTTILLPQPDLLVSQSNLNTSVTCEQLYVLQIVGLL